MDVSIDDARMSTLYADTSLTPLRVARLNSYVDWDSQPSSFKQYPDFLFRYHYSDMEALKVAEVSRCVTSYMKIGGHPYYRLNTPSAGNLHPLELYVQIRGMAGVISGIYHIDPTQECLVLIREIESEGIEPFVGLSHRFKGMLFVVSVVPFRSQWKYAARSMRYCYLDVGHQVGAILSASQLLGQKATILSDIDTVMLNTAMGFGTQEFASVVLSIGEITDKMHKPMQLPLMQVSPTDYCESIHHSLSYIQDQSLAVPYPTMTSRIGDIATIYARRSARLFAERVMEAKVCEYFINRIQEVPYGINVSIVLLKNSAREAGIYQHRNLEKAGEYAQKISHLLVDQSFVKHAAMVLVFTAKACTPHSLICAGAFAHMLHLEAVEFGLGFTGIGAFYDTQLQDFLGTQEPILYVCALGVQRDD